MNESGPYPVAHGLKSQQADRIPARVDVVSRRFLAILQYGWIVVLLLFFHTSYLGESWTNVLSFRVADGWCDSVMEGVGAHCFGDYGLPVHRGNQASVYTAGNIAATNSPSMTLFFEVFRLIPYRVGVLLYSLILIVAVLIVAWWGAVLLSPVERAAAIFTTGIGCLGAVMALDRGNHIALVAPLALVYILSIDRRAWRLASLALGVIASVKFWGIILVVGLLARRQYRYAFLSSAIAGVLYVVPLALFGGDMMSKATAMMGAVINRGYGAIVSKDAVSLYSFVGRFHCVTKDPLECSRDTPTASLPNGTVIAVLIAVGLMVWAYAMLVTFHNNAFLAYTPLLSLCFLAVPEAAPYNLVVTVVMSAVLMRSSWFRERRTVLGLQEEPLMSNWAQRAFWALCGALVLSTLPLAVWSFPAADSTGILAWFGSWRLSVWLVPVVWLYAIVMSSFALVDSHRGNIHELNQS